MKIICFIILINIIGTIDENASPNENSYNSSNAQFGFTDTSSTLVSAVTRAKFHFNYVSSLVNLFKCDILQNLVQKDKQKTEKKQKEFPTELTISLQYLPPCDETITGKLVIGVEVLFFDLIDALHKFQNGNRVMNF